MPPARPSRFDWFVAALLVSAGITAITGLQFQNWAGGKHHWWQFLFAISIPILFGFCFRDLLFIVHRERRWRACRHLPAQITVEQQVDGSIVAFVTRLDGEPRLVTLPEGYDPREDGGRHLIELLIEDDAR